MSVLIAPSTPAPRSQRQRQQQQQYDQGGEPPSSSGSSSSYSSTPRGAGNVSSSGRSREGLSSDDRGGHGPGQVDGRAGSVRGPFLTDRPARWVAKVRQHVFVDTEQLWKHHVRPLLAFFCVFWSSFVWRCDPLCRGVAPYEKISFHEIPGASNFCFDPLCEHKTYR